TTPTQQVQIRVTDGASLDYTETVTIEVLDRSSTPGESSHPAIADAVVAADVAGLVFPGYAAPAHSLQWMNEGQIEVSFATTAFPYTSAGQSQFSRAFLENEKEVARAIFANVSAFTALTFVEINTFGSTPNAIDLAVGNLGSGILGEAQILP